ncbi:MAG: hypothetical protein KAT10_03930 [Sulfurimonas sp.]|nr:hypothetical protein [Sulfurimonas sp.]
MKKLILLCLFLAFASMLSAGNYRDRGFYGSLGFLYTEDESTTSRNTTSVQTLSNNFDLGYTGNIYSPRLLQYTLKGSIRSDKLKNNTSTQKNTSNDYGIDLKFIQATQYPFRIYANQQSTPTSTQYADYSISTVQESQSQGISGSVGTSFGRFTYGASNHESVSENADKIQNTKNSNYNSSYSYNSERHNISATYSHRTEENVQYYLNNSVKSVDNNKDMLKLSYKTSILKDLKLNSEASYETDEYYGVTEVDANVDLQWRPKKANYDASLTMSATQLEYQEGDVASEFNAFNVSQTLNYKLKSGISLAQGATIYIYDAPTVTGTNTNLNLSASHSYKRDIFEDTRFSLSTRAMVQKSDSTITQVKDINSTSSTSTSNAVERYTFGVNARATKELSSIESRLSMNASVNMITSSEDRQEQRFNFDLALVSRVFYIVNNSLTASYSMSNNSNAGESSSYSTRSLQDSLNFYFRLGMRGRITFNFGMNYLSTTTDISTKNSLTPTAAVNLNYRFFRRLRFSSNINIKKYYDTLQYAGGMGLTYSAGKTSMSMNYRYTKSETQATTTAKKVENERASFKMQLTRKF